ncbi:arylsulfatase I-like [Liolophura sinensis]|uniref:arylsulfatase I-like n=1 Tax=Liolophura sinensis TaxID=3198878 RepID=UPI0031580871
MLEKRLEAHRLTSVPLRNKPNDPASNPLYHEGAGFTAFGYTGASTVWIVIGRDNYAAVFEQWHLGFFQKEYTPTYRGFKSHFGYWLGKEDYFDHVADDTYSGLDFRQDMNVVRNENGSYSTELFSSAAENIIRSHNTSEPLFLYLAYQAVHAGNGGKDKAVEAPAKYVNRFLNIQNEKRRIFAGMVSALDDSVGNVTRALRESGMMENSVIIFTTDNGGPANGYDGNAACNYPLRGLKNTMWEGGVRGTGFVYSPLLQNTGYVSSHMMHVADWLPTIYRVAGGDPSEMTTIDGYDMWDVLNSRGADVRKEILHNIDPIQNFSSIRVGDFKLVTGDISNGRNDGWYGCTPPGDDTPSGGDIVEPQAMDSNPVTFSSEDIPIVLKCGPKPSNLSTNCMPKKAPCLFNIPVDPCEYHNIADQNPNLVEMLLQKIEDYRKTSVPPRNKPTDPNANPKYYDGAWSCWMDKQTF